jgi:hypothetical protein
LNFGERPFRYKAALVDAQALSVRNWLRVYTEDLVKMEAGAQFGTLQATSGEVLFVFGLGKLFVCFC